MFLGFAVTAMISHVRERLRLIATIRLIVSLSSYGDTPLRCRAWTTVADLRSAVCPPNH
jgi:hypothetical protein